MAVNIGPEIIKVVSNQQVVGVISSNLLIVLLGFFLRRKGIFSKQVSTVLTHVVLTVAVTALSFNSFMQPLDSHTLTQGIDILIWGIVIYVLLIFITPTMYPARYFDLDERQVLSILTMFGAATLFGIPIVSAIYGSEGVVYSSVFNIGYRIFLYSYAYIKILGFKFELHNLRQMFLNPIVIVTFVGLTLWLLQPLMPHITVEALNKGVPTGKMISVAFYRIDQTAVWLWKPIDYLANLSSPLSWLAIGSALGSTPISQALMNLKCWYYSFNRVIMVPLMDLVAVILMNQFLPFKFNFVAVATTVIMMAAPTNTVAAAYSISAKREAKLTANASFLSTILAVLMAPIWVVILATLHQITII